MAAPDQIKITHQRPMITPTTPPALPPNYIDPEHTGQDRELLEVFYRACNAEGGSADEIHLRGLKAVLAAHPATPPAPDLGEMPSGELMEKEGGKPHPTYLDAIRLAQGCHDYSGGHSGQQGEAFQDGVGTVVAVLKKAAVGPWDSQVMAVFAIGSAPQVGEAQS